MPGLTLIRHDDGHFLVQKIYKAAGRTQHESGQEAFCIASAQGNIRSRDGLFPRTSFLVAQPYGLVEHKQALVVAALRYLAGRTDICVTFRRPAGL